MKTKLLLGLFIIPSLCASVKEQPFRIFLTTNEGHKIRLSHNTDGFFVRTFDSKSKKKKEAIEPAMMDKSLRNINNEQLNALVKNGSLKVNKTSDGSYALRAHISGNGGGWLSGIISYCVIKSLAIPMAMLPLAPAYLAAVEAVAQSVSTAAANCDKIP